MINTASDLWPNYAVNTEGTTFQVLVTRLDVAIGKMLVELHDPVLKYIVLRVGGGGRRCLVPGESVNLKRTDSLEIIDFHSNVAEAGGIGAFIEKTSKPLPLGTLLPAASLLDRQNGAGSSLRLDVRRERLLLGSVYLKIQQEKTIEK